MDHRIFLGIGGFKKDFFKADTFKKFVYKKARSNSSR